MRACETTQLARFLFSISACIICIYSATSIHIHPCHPMLARRHHQKLIRRDSDNTVAHTHTGVAASAPRGNKPFLPPFALGKTTTLPKRAAHAED